VDGGGGADGPTVAPPDPDEPQADGDPPGSPPPSAAAHLTPTSPSSAGGPEAPSSPGDEDDELTSETPCPAGTNLPFPTRQEVEGDAAPRAGIDRPEPQRPSAADREHQSALAFRLRWQAKKKHLFVFSSAGKPIFSRYGDESDISDFFGVMQALVSFVIDSDDLIQRLVAGRHQFVFSLHGPLYFVLVAGTPEPFASLARQLNLMHTQIVFHLTGNVARIFEKRAGYDLRQLLGGTDVSVRSLVRSLNNSPAFLLSAVQCLPMTRADRTAVGEVLRDARCPKQLFAVLAVGDALIQVVTPQRQPIHPVDLLLLMNYVNSTPSLRISTNYSPVCLPKFRDSALVYAYIDFVAEAPTPDGPVAISLTLVSTSPDPDSFAQLDAARGVIVRQLTARGLLRGILRQLQLPRYSAQEVGPPTLCHMIYRSSSSQYTATCFGPPYSLSPREQRRLLRLYASLKQRAVVSRGRTALCYYRSTHALSVVAVTKDYELYATHQLITSKLEVLAGCHRIRQWVKAHEDYLFITHSPFWP